MKSERETEHQRAKRHNYGKIAIACLPTFVSQDNSTMRGLLSWHIELLYCFRLWNIQARAENSRGITE
jgi:hypothetical protein